MGVAGGWFLIDDFGFLSDVTEQDEPRSGYLFHAHNDHLQPLGFLIVWLVGHAAPFDWALTTGITLVCRRWPAPPPRLPPPALRPPMGGLVPLGFYLFSVVTLPGFMWWCVTMMQVPQQLAAFTAMALHVEYVRTRRLRFVPLTALALAFGMLCDVKVGFVAVGLVFLSLYLSDGVGVRGRLREVVLVQWRALVPVVLLVVGYLVTYLAVNPSDGRGPIAPLAILDSMLRVVLGPVLLGGPWRWGSVSTTPLPAAATPEWAVTVAWVALALLVVRIVRRRRATMLITVVAYDRN